jgi:N-sulfoglucosamine sulfohydrolase
MILFSRERTHTLWMAVLLLLIGIQSAIGDQKSSMPNILLITVDDMNFDTPGCFGGAAELTPNIDRLAEQGMRFERAHVTLAICQASRQCLMTGRYPHNAGFRWFEPVADHVPVLTEILKRNGYMNACFGKAEHLQPRARYLWDESFDQVEIKGGRNPEVYAGLCRSFIEKAAAAGRPFFLMANSHDPHRPFHGADDEIPYRANMEKIGGKLVEPSRVYSADEAMDLGFLPSIPEVKKQTAQYMSSCRRADDTVGEILRVLDESGQAGNTLVVFLSDNGSPFPFAKGNVYLNSTRTPLIVRWPDHIKAGSVNSHQYVNGIDFMPTVLEMLGLSIPDGTDGVSFLPLLEGKDQAGRDSTVTVFYNAYPVAGGHRPELTTWFQMRCLHKGDSAYIYNGWSDGTHRFTPLATPEILDEMKQLGHTDRVDTFRLRCPEELFRFDSDPDALNNLVNHPEQESQVQRMREELLTWMETYNDTDLLPEFRAVVAAGGVTEQTPRGEGYLNSKPAKPVENSLIANGGFDAELSGWSVFKQAALLNAKFENGTCRLSASEGSPVEFARLQQKGIRLEAGSTFELTARVKGENLSGGHGAYLSIGFFSDGKPQYMNSGIRNMSGTFDWKTVRIKGTVPEGTQSATVMLVFHATGTAWFDDVQLNVE